ncbi:hypothetical protein Tco_0116413 [Tanacetum coccineum]
MLGKEPNKVYDPFLKAELGYKNLERLKKAIAAQPKMYDGESLPKSSIEQTYFSIPSTSNNSSESKDVTLELPISKMPNESKLLKLFNKMGVAIHGLRTRFDKTLLEDGQRRWMSDSQNSLREFYKTDVISMSNSLSKNLKELKEELFEEGKNVNTKFDKSETSGIFLCVTQLPKNIAVKAKKVSNYMVNADGSKPVTSHPTSKNEQGLNQNENVLARGMYRITKTETRTPDSKTNINVSNSTCVESFNNVRRPKSKDTKSKNSVLKNTNAKSSTTNVRKILSSVSIDSNKCETMNLTICHANKSVLNTKNVTSVNDGSNIVCVSCGKDVFFLSHEKCIARYALSRISSVKRALFTTPIAAKSKNLGVTSVVAKSRLSVAKTPTATNKVSRVLPLSFDSSQSRT